MSGFVYSSIYPMDSAIHLLNNRGQNLKYPTLGVNFHWQPSRLHPARIIIAVFIYTL